MSQKSTEQLQKDADRLEKRVAALEKYVQEIRHVLGKHNIVLPIPPP